MRIILILLAIFLGLAGLGTGSAMLFGIGPAHASRPMGTSSAGGVYVRMPAMEFSLPEGARLRQVRLRLVLEMPADVDRDLVNAYVPRITNALSSRMVDVDAADLYGADGARVVKSVVAMAANRELRPLRVRQVLVQEMVMR